MSEPSINRYLDHAVLKPELTQTEAAQEIEVGLRYSVFSVCVRPADIRLAQDLCRGSQTSVSCVLGFPHGTLVSESKVDEAQRYANLGVTEIDMVANYGLILSEQWQRVHEDMAAVARITRPARILLKVILETSALKLEHIARATEIAVDIGADFVKTSTGFGSGGATEEAVRAMLAAGRDRIGVKASGGIRDYRRARLFIDLGCKRLGVGSASTPAICEAVAAVNAVGGVHAEPQNRY
ncbi:MAG: deoxyribose-phosphate aldolase [Pirellulales bacterium]|nr:deoxyribose-phosphate aldolase [Pirellulales bacterium]